MKSLLIVVALVAIGLAKTLGTDPPQQPPGDAEISQRVVGTWIINLQLRNDVFVNGAVTIVSNGSFFTKATIVRGDSKREVKYEGRWQVKDGALIETVTKTDAVDVAPAGTVTHDRVIRVNDEELVFQTEGGITDTRRRSK